MIAGLVERLKSPDKLNRVIRSLFLGTLFYLGWEKKMKVGSKANSKLLPSSAEDYVPNANSLCRLHLQKISDYSSSLAHVLQTRASCS